jgi:hypothetical protein
MYDTHDEAHRTIADDYAPCKRLKVLPQLSSELRTEILRHRSMQIEVARKEQLNRHRELGYQAVLCELSRLSFRYNNITTPSGDYRPTPQWIKCVLNDIKEDNLRKRTKQGRLFKQWKKYLTPSRTHHGYIIVRLLYVSLNELRAGTISHHL